MKTTKEKSSLKKYFHQYKEANFTKGNRAALIVYQVLTVVVIAALVVQAIQGNYEHCFTCVLTLILFLVPNFLEKKLKVTMPQTLEVIIILFIFSAQMLGELRAFYLKFPWWDTMLHTMNGFLMAAIGFSLVDILNENENFKFDLSPMFIAVVSFCFSMTIGVLWEFFEFFADIVMEMDMQKDTIITAFSSVDFNSAGLNVPVRISGIDEIIMRGGNLALDGAPINEYVVNGGYIDMGIIDTMNDLIVNFIGAVVFSVLGYVYIKNRGKGFAAKFIPKRETADKD